jgi:hypothetical protein
MPKRIVLAAVRGFNTPAVRYPPDPRAVFMLALCVVVGVPLIFAGATPGTIASQLDHAWVIAWGIMLSGGSLLSLIGSSRQSVNGVIAEQIGSVALGVACAIYAGAIIAAVHWAGAVPAAMVIGLGGASFWRWGQLQAYLHDSERLAQKIRERRGELGE